MKVLLLGGSGQLGQDLQSIFQQDEDIQTYSPTSSEINVADDSIKKILGIEFDCLINCTSYHKVDEVEDNPEKAFKVNAFAVAELSKICAIKNRNFLSISTDYVFGGHNIERKLMENDPVAPLNVYGSSKAFGENLVLYNNPKASILRVASLFGVAGSSGKGGNFVNSIIKAAKQKNEITVVNDQIMSPTSTSFIASTIYFFIKNRIYGGIFNVVCRGEVSWYEFAKKIIDLEKINCSVIPINTDTLNQKAVRPKYSALSTKKIQKLGIEIPDYETELISYLAKINN